MSSIVVETTIFKKRLLVLRMKLSGLRYYRAMDALTFAEDYHRGKRKDGITPELDHQVCICLYLLTICKLLTDPEATIATAILHDVPEDYPVIGLEIMKAIFGRPEDEAFGEQCIRSIDLLNKNERDGDTPKQEDALYGAMARDSVASIVKAVDRWHNLNSMVDVFTFQKQAKYVEFAETRILPMMRLARRNFPRQEDAYENIKWKLKDTIALVRAMHRAVGVVSETQKIAIG